MAYRQTGYRRKVIGFDPEIFQALDILSRDSGKNMQELANEAFALLVEINGRGISAFNAESKIAGEAFIEEEWFRSDLMTLEGDGTPLWNGKSEIYLREALPEEADQWRVAYARTQFKSIDSEFGVDARWLLYLVPVSDPTDNSGT
jgi:hypothetical protein